VTSPRIDHQLLEARLGSLGELHRGLQPALGATLVDVGLDLLHERGHLPVGEPRHRLAEGAGHPVDGLLVEQPAVERRRDDGEGLDVGLAVQGTVAQIGEAQCSPQPFTTLTADTALGGGLLAGETGVSTQDQAGELVPELFA
jgi:hypothetical protein